jgi:hypothetical protein
MYVVGIAGEPIAGAVPVETVQNLALYTLITEILLAPEKSYFHCFGGE